MRGSTCLVWLGKPRISVITHRIGTLTCHIRNFKLTRTQNSLKSQSLMMISLPPSPLISIFLILNSTITSEHEVESSLSISPCNDQELTPSTAYTKYSIYQVQHTPSTAYTEYSIHRVQHTLSTAYTQYSIHPVQHTPSTTYTEYSIHRILHHPKIECLILPTSRSSLGRPYCAQFSTFPQF